MHRLQAEKPSTILFNLSSAIAVLKESYSNRSELVGLGLAILLSGSAGAVDTIAYLEKQSPISYLFESRTTIQSG